MRYVFDYMQPGPQYVLRAPAPIARLICRVADRFGRTWDYGTVEDVTG